MNDMGIIAWGAGLQDGLNPCIFMASASLIATESLINARSFRIIWLRIIFGLTYLIGIINFNFGPAQILVLSKDFILVAKIIYLILGAVSFTLGLLYFRGWFLLHRGKLVTDEAHKRIKYSFPMECLMVIALAMLLSALATLWPVNNYILLLGMTGIMKGQWSLVMPLLAGYSLISMWPLWFCWGVLSIRNLRPSFLKIFCAAIFFAASSCMILMFR